MGMSFHTPRPPTDVNCPREVSRKKRGIPANTSVMKYGIRKAPAYGRKYCIAQCQLKVHHKINI